MHNILGRLIFPGVLRTARIAASFCLVLSLASCSGQQVLREFSSDGCSLFPDGNLNDRKLWCECCYAHDIAYWRGGTDAERTRADEQLRTCVQQKTGDAALAQTMFMGVRAGGHPVFPNGYRWGYGWSYGRGYAPLNADEEKRVLNALARQSSSAAQFSCQ